VNHKKDKYELIVGPETYVSNEMRKFIKEERKRMDVKSVKILRAMLDTRCVTHVPFGDLFDPEYMKYRRGPQNDDND
jgi:hypothetical protein